MVLSTDRAPAPEPNRRGIGPQLVDEVIEALVLRARSNSENCTVDGHSGHPTHIELVEPPELALRQPQGRTPTGGDDHVCIVAPFGHDLGERHPTTGTGFEADGDLGGQPETLKNGCKRCAGDPESPTGVRRGDALRSVRATPGG